MSEYDKIKNIERKMKIKKEVLKNKPTFAEAYSTYQKKPIKKELRTGFKDYFDKDSDIIFSPGRYLTGKVIKLLTPKERLSKEEFAKQYNKKIDTAFKKAVSDYNKDIDKKIKSTEGNIKFSKKGDRPGMFSDLLGIKTMPGKKFITPPDPKAEKRGKEKLKELKSKKIRKKFGGSIGNDLVKNLYKGF